MKAPGAHRLKLNYDEPLSNVAFKFSLRRYIPVLVAAAAVQCDLRDAAAAVAARARASARVRDVLSARASVLWGVPHLAGGVLEPFKLMHFHNDPSSQLSYGEMT